MPVNYNILPSPCFVIDEERFRRNLELLRFVADESGAEIILALKGFAMWGSFPVFCEYFSGAAASSAHEARLCFEKIGNKAHTYSPAYREDEFHSVMENSSHITFNSLEQFGRYYPGIKDFPEYISVGLRINPDISSAKHLLYDPCSPGSRLGIPAGDLEDSLPGGVEGLHFHVLFESDSYALERVLEVVETRFGKLFGKLKWINMGGGHLITGKEYDRDHLIDLIKKFRERWGLHVILEPGSAFAWETGELVSTVLDVVDNKGVKTAILDTSFAAHMPDCLEMPYKPEVSGAVEPDPEKPTYRLGGNSCLSGDVMGDWTFERALKPGDRIIFKDMIHYTMVKTTTFNGVYHPSIGIWTSDNKFRLLREFGYEDYRSRLS